METFDENKSEKKKVNPVLGVLKSLLVMVLFLLCIVSLWTVFSCIDRKNPLTLLPRGYAAYLHTDSAWDAISPLIDLRASDEILASAEFSQFREGFMALRETEIRESKIVQLLLSRRIDASLYGKSGEQHFSAIADMGALSAITRFLGVVPLKIDGLKRVKGKYGAYLEYQNKNNLLFIKPFHNLLLISDDFSLFENTLEANAEYSPSEIALMTKKDGQKVRIVCDVRSLFASISDSDKNPELCAIMDAILSENAMCTVSFAIADDKISLRAALPCLLEDSSALNVLLSRKSTLPSLSVQLGDTVQYYTMLNLGTLGEMKDAFFPFIPESQNAPAIWKRADGACRTAFSMSLEELLFSWTGREFAVLGIEGLNDPVFAVQIADEDARKSVFARVVSSILVKNASPFILGGARLEQLKFPAFLNGVLSLFGVKLPSPYYMVHDGFIYFSESPETLSSVFSAGKNGARLASAESFKAVSDGMASEFSLSLFYNLERSVPFFLRSSSAISKVLSLYSLGRCDIAIDGGEIALSIQASSGKIKDSAEIAGFPIETDSRATSQLEKEAGEKGSTVFWTENEKIIKACDLHSLAVSSREVAESAQIIASAHNLRGNGALWAVTKSGAVYLFSKKLDAVPGFPVLTGEKLTAAPAVQGNALVFPTQSGALCFVDDSGKTEIVPLPLNGSIKSAPAVLGDVIAVYDKSFRGQIFLLQNRKIVNAENPLLVPGIAFGSPALFAPDSKTLSVAFITQAGNLYLWQNGAFPSGFPMKLEGNFKSNVATDGKNLYAISSQAKLYRIGENAETISVEIPNRTASDGGVSVRDGRIFVSVDGNVIYGFDSSSLELLAKFPLPGFGAPVLADVNGDKKEDCVVLSMDKKLFAWNAR